jgi:dipeptidyl aminopeptidase/acylaminoacyl peptidase
LKKENWEVAIYPAERHGFQHASSWTDEYRRIFKLFEQTLK